MNIYKNKVKRPSKYIACLSNHIFIDAYDRFVRIQANI